MTTIDRTALSDLVSDHLHPAMTHALGATQWLHKAIDKATFRHSRPNLRQVLDFAREDLRQAMAELDAFEAGIYQPAPIAAVTLSDEGKGINTLSGMAGE